MLRYDCALYIYTPVVVGLPAPTLFLFLFLIPNPCRVVNFLPVDAICLLILQLPETALIGR